MTIGKNFHKLCILKDEEGFIDAKSDIKYPAVMLIGNATDETLAIATDLVLPSQKKDKQDIAWIILYCMAFLYQALLLVYIYDE